MPSCVLVLSVIRRTHVSIIWVQIKFRKICWIDNLLVGMGEGRSGWGGGGLLDPIELVLWV